MVNVILMEEMVNTEELRWWEGTAEQATEAQAVVARSAAEKVISSGLKREELADHIKTLEEKPTGAALLALVLAAQKEIVPTCAWCKPDTYGPALQYLLSGEGKVRDQMLALYELQRYCHSMSFPKVTVKSGKRYLIEVIFQIFYERDVVEQSGFEAWADDEEEEGKVKGKKEALFQTTQFMLWLTEEEENEDEEEEEDEVDAVRETVP